MILIKRLGELSFVSVIAFLLGFYMQGYFIYSGMFQESVAYSNGLPMNVIKPISKSK